jgi:hypothetical protein
MKKGIIHENHIEKYNPYMAINNDATNDNMNPI